MAMPSKSIQLSYVGTATRVKPITSGNADSSTRLLILNSLNDSAATIAQFPALALKVVCVPPRLLLVNPPKKEHWTTRELPLARSRRSFLSVWAGLQVQMNAFTLAYLAATHHRVNPRVDARLLRMKPGLHNHPNGSGSSSSTQLLFPYANATPLSPKLHCSAKTTKFA